MNKIFSVIDYTIIHATVRATTPILLAAFASVITQQADILNVGVEGIMLMGAFIAVYVCFSCGNSRRNHSGNYGSSTFEI